MKKITLLSLLLLVCGAMGVKAQVVPQISTGEMVYEYYLKFPKFNKYAKKNTSTTGASIVTTTTAEDYLKVKLVASATEDNITYVNIVPTNAISGDNFICAAGTASGAAIKYSETAESNGDWRFSIVNETTLTTNMILKGSTVAISNPSKNTGRELQLYAAENDHSDTYFIPANANAENFAVLPKVETILANGGKTGFLATTDALHTALQAAYNTFSTSGTSEKLAVVKTAYDNYKASTAVVLPADGKAYTITSVQQTGDYVLYFDDAAAGDDKLKIGAKDVAASEYGASAIFVCRRVGDKCVFVNAGKGNYLSYRGKNTDYAENINAYTMRSVNAATVSDNVTAEIPFGLFCPYAKRPNDANREGSLIIKIENNVGANENYDDNICYKNNLSNIVRIEEVTDYSNAVNFTASLGENTDYVATFSAPFPTVVPEDVTAYYATDNFTESGVTTVEMTPLAGEAIPANTGVVLISTKKANGVSMLPRTTETVAEFAEGKTTNYLAHSAGAAKNITENLEAGETAYILANGANGVGFYALDASDATIAMNKSYLVLGAAAQAVKLVFGGDNATGIEAIDNGELTMDNAPVYDLSGRRVLAPAKGGIYVKNGKKFIVK